MKFSDLTYMQKSDRKVLLVLLVVGLLSMMGVLFFILLDLSISFTRNSGTLFLLSAVYDHILLHSKAIAKALLTVLTTGSTWMEKRQFHRSFHS